MVRKKWKLLKLSFREIRHNWFQYLSMIAIVALAITLFTGFVSNCYTLQKRVDDLFADANIFDLCAYTTALTIDDVAFFDNLENTTVEYRLYGEGSIDSYQAKIYLGDNTISQPIIASGSSGVLIDSAFAESHGYNVGDKIQIELTAYSASFEVEITGTMCFAEVTSTKSVCPIYISIDQNQFLSPLFSTYKNQALIKTDNITNVKYLINNHYSDKDNLLFILDEDTTESFTLLENEVSQSKAMIYVFPVIFLFVSVLVILTTISQLILRERMNIGTLKALGYNNWEIASHYSSVGIIVTMIGAVIGVFIGPKIIPYVMEVKYELVYNLPAYDGVIYSFFWSIMAIVAVGLLSAILSFLICHDVLHETPAQCMRPKAPKNRMLIRLIGGDDHDEPITPVN